MRPFQFSDYSDDVHARAQALDLIEPTFGEYLQARLGSITTVGSPYSKIQEDARQKIANQQEDYSGFGLNHAPDAETMAIYQDVFTQKRLDAKELNDKYGIPGALSFDSPMTEKSAEMKYNFVRNEIERQQVISRYSHSNMLIDFGIDMAGSMLDPLNIASMFIPVPGINGIERLGVGALGKAALTGAAHGAMGMAVLEPINMVLDNDLGFQHTAEDAAYNIMLGAGIGGLTHTAMHGVGRLLNDGLVSTQAHNAAFKTAVAQLVQGEDTNVGIFHKIDASMDDLGVKQYDMMSTIGGEEAERQIAELRGISKTPESLYKEAVSQMSAQKQVQPEKPIELNDAVSTYKMPDEQKQVLSKVETDVADLENSARLLLKKSSVLDVIGEEHANLEKELGQETNGVMEAIKCIVNKEL